MIQVINVTAPGMLAKVTRLFFAMGCDSLGTRLPLLQLYLISRCDSTAIAFKQDELCFHVLVCYQKSSESGEMEIVSCKNCYNFITERF